MAVRLPIVLCQSEPTDSTGPSDDLILTHLFMERGWDATLLGKLDQIDVGSTDDLCLSSITGPFVLLSRHDIASIAEQLDRLKVSGRLYQPLVGTAPRSLGPSSRSIYFFQITTNEAFESSLQSIRKIQESLGKQVFTIQLGNIATSIPKQGSSEASPVEKQRENQKESGGVALAGTNEPLSTQSVALTRLPNESTSILLDSSEEASLDLLLDQLDQADV